MKRLALAALVLLCVGSALMAHAADGEGDKRFQLVTVKPGDTLWSISNTWLKDPAKWDEIPKYNHLPSSDPTVALPGMTLRVPLTLIKDEMRAATLVFRSNRVEFRRQDSAQWKTAADAMQLNRGDSIHTFESSQARVKFVNAQILSLESDSLAVIKPVAKDYDLELKGGGVFVGHSRIVTASARITPKTADTEYSARVRKDMSTLVEVYKGVAAVDAQGKTVEVSAGMSAEVRLGMTPEAPKPIADLPEFEARVGEFHGGIVSRHPLRDVGAGSPPAAQVGAGNVAAPGDINALDADMKGLSIGQPVSGYRVQAARDREFSSIVFDKTYNADDGVRLKSENIRPGVYWWRVAMVDLLGTELGFSAPRRYSIGGQAPVEDARESADFQVLQPAADVVVSVNSYRITGTVKSDGANVTVNGKAVRVDESGNFFATIQLQPGPNTVKVQASDASGRFRTISRRITYTMPQ